MSGIFNRVTVRAASDTTGIFVPETPERMYQGADEMTIVMVAKLRTPTPATFDSFYCNRGSWAGAPASGGFRLWFSSELNQVVWQFVDGAQSLSGNVSRVFVAGDVGKTHRIVATLLDGTTSLYVNSHLSDDFAFTGYTAPTGVALLASVLGEAAPGGASYESGVKNWEVMDIALLGQGMTADQVALLDKQIRAGGRIPTQYDWAELYRAERLNGHSLVWDAGGLSAGRGWPAWEGDAPILGVAETLWGGF